MLFARERRKRSAPLYKDVQAARKDALSAFLDTGPRDSKKRIEVSSKILYLIDLQPVPSLTERVDCQKFLSKVIGDEGAVR